MPAAGVPQSYTRTCRHKQASRTNCHPPPPSSRPSNVYPLRSDPSTNTSHPDKAGGLPDSLVCGWSVCLYMCGWASWEQGVEARAGPCTCKQRVRTQVVHLCDPYLQQTSRRLRMRATQSGPPTQTPTRCPLQVRGCGAWQTTPPTHPPSKQQGASWSTASGRTSCSNRSCNQNPTATQPTPHHPASGDPNLPVEEAKRRDQELREQALQQQQQ